MKRMRADFEFVEYMPPELKKGIIYVSMVYATASHLCMCGCGERIVTPFSPTDWKLTFDGDSISIFPSIGDWDLTCDRTTILQTTWCGGRQHGRVRKLRGRVSARK